MGVIYNGKKTKKFEKGQPNYEMFENELGQKKDHPTNPFDEYQWRIE